MYFSSKRAYSTSKTTTFHEKEPTVQAKSMIFAKTNEKPSKKYKKYKKSIKKV